MMDNIGKYLPGILMIVTELGAAVVMRISDNRIDASHLTGNFLREPFNKLRDNAVDTAYSRDGPDLVANSDLSVRAAKAHECPFFLGGRYLYQRRLICIIQNSGEIGLNR